MLKCLRSAMGNRRDKVSRSQECASGTTLVLLLGDSATWVWTTYHGIRGSSCEGKERLCLLFPSSPSGTAYIQVRTTETGIRTQGIKITKPTINQALVFRLKTKSCQLVMMITSQNLSCKATS